MKFMVLIAMSVFIIACGKENTSGKGSLSNGVNAPVANTLHAEEEVLRNEFINQGQVLLTTYQTRVRQVLGGDALQRMKNALRAGNISFSREELIGPNRRMERSQRNKNGGRTLYIGDKRPEMSWSEILYKRDKNLEKLLMHELVEMANIDDRNLQYSSRILQ